jgi:hypothetical protein
MYDRQHHHNHTLSNKIQKETSDFDRRAKTTQLMCTSLLLYNQRSTCFVSRVLLKGALLLTVVVALRHYGTE